MQPTYGPAIIQLPCGTNTTAGDPGEGAIEIKAAWRRLTTGPMMGPWRVEQRPVFHAERHFLHRPAREPALTTMRCGGSLPCTSSTRPNRFRTSSSRPGSRSTITMGRPPTLITWRSRIGRSPKTGCSSALLPNIPVTRANPIHSQVAATNTAVHAAFMAQNPATVWQYYKLVGVQGTPMTSRRLPTRRRTISATSISPTSWSRPIRPCRISSGWAPTARDSRPSLSQVDNVYLKGASGSPFQMGGCQGCHGFQGQDAGGDMSVLVAAAPYDTLFADSLDAAALTPSEPITSAGLVLSSGPV